MYIYIYIYIYNSVFIGAHTVCNSVAPCLVQHFDMPRIYVVSVLFNNAVSRELYYSGLLGSSHLLRAKA